CYRRDETVALPGERADVSRLCRVVVEGPAGERNGARQRALGRDGAGPELLEQLLPANDAAVVLGEIAQDAHRSSLERNDRVAAVEKIDFGHKPEGWKLEDVPFWFRHSRRSRTGGRGWRPSSAGSVT